VLCGGELPASASSRPEESLERLEGGVELRRAVARAVAFEPSQRFASVGQFCESLRRAIDAGERVTARAPEAYAAEPRPAILEVRNLSLAFGDREVVRDLSVAVLAGELVGLLGSSGSGVNALLSMIGGRLRPSRGDVRLRGAPVDPTRVGFVSDDAFRPDLTVDELMRGQLQMHAAEPLSADAIDARLRAVLESVELSPDLVSRHQPDELSRSMRRRLSIAMELATEPEVLLIENVTADLDPRQARSIVLLCRTLSSRGLTVVMLMPALSDAEFYLFDRVIVIGRSALLWSGPPYDAVRWFESQSRAAAPLARTAVDFVHEASSADAEGQVGFLESPDHERHVAAPLRSVVAAAPSQRVARPRLVRPSIALYARQLLRRRRYVVARLLQPALFGAVIGALAFSNVAGSGLFPALVMAAFWLGASGSIGEVVRERSVFLRLRASGASPESYLAPLLTVQAALALVQIAILYVVCELWLFVANGGRMGSLTGDAIAYIVLYLVGVSAALHGLVASALLARRSPQSRWFPSGRLAVVVALAVVVILSGSLVYSVALSVFFGGTFPAYTWGGPWTLAFVTALVATACTPRLLKPIGPGP
jgi:ABC-type multidrug transport system ATPase subunit